jgi:hypothetical protein
MKKITNWCGQECLRSSEYLQDNLGKILEHYFTTREHLRNYKKHKFHVKQQFSTRFNKAMDDTRKRLNRGLKSCLKKLRYYTIVYADFEDKHPSLFANDGIHLSFIGNDIFMHEPTVKVKSGILAAGHLHNSLMNILR